jgi:hypothetical protein
MRVLENRAAAIASMLTAGALAVLLSGCTPTGSASTERPGGATVGEAETCPGEFLHSLANERTAAGAAVDVVEDEDPVQFDEIGTDGLACVAKLSGNRTLPSGAPEPEELVGLYEGDVADMLTARVEALGFASSNGSLYRRGGELLRIRTEASPRLGIEGEATFTLVSVMDSEELADIRAPR